MSRRPRPTTVKPMTAPEEKATLRPLFRLSLAAWAVRACRRWLNLHADKARQSGIDASGEKGEGNEPVVQQLEVGQDQQNQEDHEEDLGHGGVLIFQVGVGSLADGGGKLFHGVVPLGEGEHPAALEEGKEEGGKGPRQSDPKANYPFLTHSLGLLRISLTIFFGYSS